MARIILFITITFYASSCTQSEPKSFVRDKSFKNCDCDTTALKNIITANTDSIVIDSITINSFYELDSAENRELWFKDITSPFPTKYTNLWNAYWDNNYHADGLDFINYFENKDDIELAFQLGPNADLWAYHSFVFKKKDCCYIATHSYFRHARFTYKSFAIINQSTIDSLYAYIDILEKKPRDSLSYGYHAYFSDNNSNSNYFVSLENADKVDEQLNHIKQFYQFLDSKITWQDTYSK